MAEFCKILISTLLIVLIASAIDAAVPINGLISSTKEIDFIYENSTESNHYYSLGLEQNGNVKYILIIIRQILQVFIFILS